MSSFVGSACGRSGWFGLAWGLATGFNLALTVAVNAGDIRDYARRGDVHLPTAGAFQDMFDALPDGRVIVLAANDVYLETAAGSRSFELLGPLTGDGAPILYPAFLKASPDGTRIAIGNNFNAVGVFDVETLSGDWFPVGHYDAEWFDDVHLGTRAAGDVTLLDTASDPDVPINPLLVTGGPVSAGITFDTDGNLYTGTGLTGNGPSETGWVKGFTFARWQGVLSGDPPIDYEAEGTLICDLLSAASLGFDDSGNFFVGGGDFQSDDNDALALVAQAAVAGAWAGEGPADPDNSEEVRRLDPDSSNDSNWYDATFNVATGELLVRDAWTSIASVYTQPGGVSCDGVSQFVARCGESGAVRAKLRLLDRPPQATSAYIAVDGVALQSTVSRRRAVWRVRGVGGGEHVVALTDPAECLDPVIVVCP